MGLLDFLKDTGEKLFGKDNPQPEDVKTMLNDDLPGVEITGVMINDGTVSLHGTADSYSTKNKAVLMAGNVKGIDKVNDDNLKVDTGEPEAPPEPVVEYYTIQSGDSLSKIAKAKYGDAMKYPTIFEANKEVIKDPNKIYPGQKIVIPKLEA
ncbi:MAG: peptidoglycan-binding protein LysM [Bacteroidota bacterium]